MARAIDILRRNFEIAMEKLAQSGRDDFTSKHPGGSGKTASQIQPAQLKVGLSEVSGVICTDIVGISQDQGVEASKIPYTVPPPFRGGTSDYIQGLIKFAETTLNLSGAAAKGAAFAIAAKHKSVGMPIDKSKLGWIKSGLEAHEGELIQNMKLNEFLEAAIDEQLDELRKLPNVTVRG